jgi:hypothetical protein
VCYNSAWGFWQPRETRKRQQHITTERERWSHASTLSIANTVLDYWRVNLLSLKVGPSDEKLGTHNVVTVGGAEDLTRSRKELMREGRGSAWGMGFLCLNCFHLPTFCCIILLRKIVSWSGPIWKVPYHSPNLETCILFLFLYIYGVVNGRVRLKLKSLNSYLWSVTFYFPVDYWAGMMSL